MMNTKLLLWLSLTGVTLGLVRFATMSGDRKNGARWNALPLRNKRLALEIEKRAAAQGLQVGFFDGWRHPNDQLQKMKAGTSKVVDPFSSYHVWGEAIDMVPLNSAGQFYWPDGILVAADGSHYINPIWEKLGRIGEQLGLTWGGRWYNVNTKTGFFDGAHFQSSWIDTATLKFNYGNNPAAYLRDQNIVVT